MKLITSLMLRGACKEQRALFRKTFPGGAPVTVAAARKAQKAGLDVGWLVGLLPAPIYAEWQAKRASIDAEWLAKRAPIDAEYRAKCAPIDAEYRAKCAPIDAEWEAKRDALLVSLLRKAERSTP